jgi:xanthine dehydrogenase accessory factor
MYSLLKSLKDYDPQQDYVLAIIIDAKGSTYRKPGAMMVINDKQQYWGLISGGCLEGDIVLNSEKVIQQQTDKELVYNMRDESDLLWGMGLGCDGEVTVLLKYLAAADRHLGFFQALTRWREGQSLNISILNDDANELKIIPLEENTTIETNYSSSATRFSFNLKKPHHLLICGGSPDVPPVTAIAHQVGWKTTVIDHRPDSAQTSRFPFAESVQLVKRSQWQAFDLSPFDSAIIMSHQFEHDQRYLQTLLSSDLSYIGLLGPTKRRDQLLANCNTQFNLHQGRIFGPIGLDIGSDSPETIALAIIAEVQAIQNKKSTFSCYQDSTR